MASAASVTADLEIFAWANEPIGAGEVFQLEIELYNYGPDTATGITFTDTLPAGTAFQSIESQSSNVACSHAAGVVTCTVATLFEEDGAYVSLNVLAPATDGTITNQVAVTAQTPADPFPEDNTYTSTFDVRSDADLYVVQTAPNIAIAADATFRVYFGNNGPKTATDATLVVHLPEETAYVSHTAPAGITCTPENHTLTCLAPSLPRTSEEDDPPSITVTVEGLPSAGILTSVASISAVAPADPNAANNQDTEVVVVGSPPLADLYAFSSSTQAIVGAPAVLTTEVYNEGPQPATGVQFVDTLPAGLTFVSATVTGGTCSHTAGVVTCDLGALATDAFRNVLVTVTPTTLGAFKHSVKVTAASPADPDPDGNADSATVTVYPAGSANFFLYTAAGPGTVLAGADARYTLIAYNDGPSTTSDAVVKGTLPAGIDYAGSTTPAGVACSFDAGTRVVSCTLGSLGPNASRTFDVLLRKPTPGSLAANFAVEYALDIDPDDNATSVGSTVVAAETASLSGFWWTQSSFTPQGVPLRLRFGARNAGPATAQGVTASIQLPASFAFISASSPYGTCQNAAGVVTCNLGSIPSDDARAVSVIVLPTALGSVTVNGSVAEQAPSIDPSASNNGIAIGMSIVSAIVSAPTATMPGAQSITDPVTGEVQVIAAYDAIGPLTIGAAAQCPGGGPIGANTVAFGQSGISRIATPVAGGRFETTFPAEELDAVRFYGLVLCPPAATVQNRIGTIDFFLPLGTVTNAATSQPVSGATVTLYRVPNWLPRLGAYQDAVPATCESSASKLSGAAWGQAAPTGLGVQTDERSGYISPAVNPMQTNPAGHYGWFLETSGCWYVVVSKPGFVTATSPVLGTSEFEEEPDPLNVQLEPIVRTLTVTSTSGGSVTSTPAGISCPTDCTETYADGAVVTLTAHPTTGWTTSWTGACAAAIGNGCVLALTGNLGAGATFTPPPPPPPPPDLTAPTVTLKLAKQKRAAVLRSGLVSTVSSNEACTFKLELRLTTAMARKLGLPVVIGTATKSLTGAGSAKIAVKLKAGPKRKLAKLASVKITLVIVATDAARNARTVKRTVTVRR